MARKLSPLQKELEANKVGYKVVLEMPYHPRLAYLLNDSRKTSKTKLGSLIEFFSALPIGYGGIKNIKMQVEELSIDDDCRK